MKLQDVCSYVADKIDNSALNKDNYISTENMMQNCGGVTAASNVPVGKSTRFVEGDILFSNIRPYFKKLWRANTSGGCSADVLCIRANEKINPTYLYYFLTQDLFISYVMAGTKGCKMPRGDKQYNMAWNINLPSLDVQEKIAAQLSEIDDKIAVNRRICENLEAQAQALFKHWFIDFVPFKNGQFVESELGMIPEGWRVGTLEELCSMVGSGGTPKSSNKEYYLGTIPWFGTGEFNDSFLFDSIKHITEEAVNNSSARFYPIHTVLIAMYGATVGKLSILSVEATFNQAALGMVAKETIGYPFVYLTLLRNRKQLVNLACGAAQQNLNAGNIKTYVSIIPPKHVMNDFNNVIMPIFDLIEKQNAESTRLSTLRDTLLPKLMSGQIKV